MNFERNVWYVNYYSNSNFSNCEYKNSVTNGIIKQDPLNTSQVLISWNNTNISNWICYNKETILPMLIMFGDPIYE